MSRILNSGKNTAVKPIEMNHSMRVLGGMPIKSAGESLYKANAITSGKNTGWQI